MNLYENYDMHSIIITSLVQASTAVRLYISNLKPFGDIHQFIGLWLIPLDP